MKFVYLADYPDALTTIAQWYYKEWGDQHGITSVKESEKILADYANGYEIPLIILAIEENDILGAVQLKYYEMDIYPNKEHWLGGVYIPEKFRRKRIARELVSHAMKIAKSQNVERLYLQTERVDGGLYKELGWRPIEIITYRGKKVLVMKVDL